MNVARPAAAVPSLGWRRAIWVASLAVQGGWLAFSLRDLGRTGPDLFFGWWAFATAASGVALAAERDNPDAEMHPTGRSR